MMNCQMKDKAYQGNCEGCTQREYCMLSEIMDKLHTLEATVAQLKARKAS
jgi:hypothetical protein